MIFKKGLPFPVLPLAISVALAGCNDDNVDQEAIKAPESYTFASTANPSASSSVNYQAATTRYLLIKELEALIDSNELSELAQTEGADSAIERLNRIYEIGTIQSNNTNLSATNIYDDSTTPTPIRSITLPEGLKVTQTDFSQLQENINLKSVIAGVQSDLNFRNAQTEEYGSFIGWSISDIYDGDLVPNQFIQQCFTGIANSLAAGVDHFNMDSGVDYKALLISFLKASISYSQITDYHLGENYLDSTKTASLDYPDSTPLQHNWDMAFGYLGSLQHSNPQLNTAHEDKNANGEINLFTEYEFYQHSEAKRLDNTPLAETNFYRNLSKLFLDGRQVIQEYSNGERESLNPKLNTIHSEIIEDIEKLNVASVIRHINDINRAIPYYRVSDTFKKQYFTAWSNLKGTALALQLNPYSKLNLTDIDDIHKHIDVNPETAENFISVYLRDLEKVNEKLIQTFSFSESNSSKW